LKDTRNSHPQVCYCSHVFAKQDCTSFGMLGWLCEL